MPLPTVHRGGGLARNPNRTTVLLLACDRKLQKKLYIQLRHCENVQNSGLLVRPVTPLT